MNTRRFHFSYRLLKQSIPTVAIAVSIAPILESTRNRGVQRFSTKTLFDSLFDSTQKGCVTLFGSVHLFYQPIDTGELL